MTAFTTTQVGPSSASSTWGGGGLTPGTGDGPVTLNHHVTWDVGAVIGRSGAATQLDLIVDANGQAGQLTIAAAVALTVRGSARLENAVLTLDAGASYLFGDGGTGQAYRLRVGDATNQTNTRIVCNGTAGARCVVGKESPAAGNGGILPDLDNGSYVSGITATYTTFRNLGTAGSGYGSRAIDVSPSGASQKLYLSDCTMEDSSTLHLRACPAARDVDIDGLDIVRPLNAVATSPNISLTQSAPTTGLRRFKRVTAQDSYIRFATSLAGYEIEDVICAKMIDSTVTGAAPAYRRNVVILQRAQAIRSVFGVIESNETALGGGMFLDMDGEDNAGFDGTGGSLAGTMTFDKWVYGHTGPHEGTDFHRSPGAVSAGGVMLQRIARGVMLHNSRGKPSGNMGSSHGTNRTNMEWVHNAGGTHEKIPSASNAWFMANIGTGYKGHAGMVPRFQGNIVQAEAPLIITGVGGMGLEHYGGAVWTNAGESIRGTSNSSSTTMLLQCPGKGWATAARQTLVDSGAYVVITGGTGPPAGETRMVAANTATTITPGSYLGSPAAFSVAPNGTTTYVVVVLDAVTPSGIRYNAYSNARIGRIYGPDGWTTWRDLIGYEGLVVSDLAVVATGDLNLGNAANQQTDPAGFMFLDPSRNWVNYESRVLYPLGLVSQPPVWAASQTFVVGDRVRAQTTDFYANEELFFICHTSKGSASAAADKPGNTTNPATWRLYWRLGYGSALTALIKGRTTITDADLGLTAASVIAHSLKWMRRGYASRNPLTRNATPDIGYGTDFGAEPFFGAVLDSNASIPLGGSGTLSPASPPPLDSSGPILLGGSGTLSVPIQMASVGALGIGGSGTLAVASSVAGMTGVKLLIRAVTTDRPLLLRVAPPVPVVLDSSGAIVIGGSGTISVGSALDSTAAIPLGGSGTLIVPITMASSGAIPLGGSGTLTVPIVLDSSGQVLIGGSGDLSVAGSGAPADLVQLITDLGGDATIYAAYDVRHNLTHAGGFASAIDDVRGTSGFGPQCAQATGSKQPAWDGTTLNFDGVDDVLLSAYLAALSLDTSRSFALIGAVNSGVSNRYALGISNAGLTRLLAIYASATNILARHTDSVGNSDQNTLKTKGTAIRCTTTQQRDTTRAMTTKTFAGSAVTTPVPTGTVASENKRISIGGIGDSLWATPKVRAVIVSASGVFWTTTQRDLINTWALANHASVDA